MALTRPRYSQIYDTDYKQSVRVATTADVGNLVAGYQSNSVDGKTVAVNDRILVKNQSNTMQNGIYYVTVVGTGSNGTWLRAIDADANDKVTSGLTTIVADGNVNVGKSFRLTTSDPIFLGNTGLTFVDPSTSPAPAGANTQVQFNDAGITSATAGFTFNKFSNAVSIGGSLTTLNAGNISAGGYFLGNGSQLTGIVAGSNYSNVQVATYLPTYTGVVTASNVAVNGNVTARYLFGNGSQLTGLPSSYSNIQVAAYLPTYTGNVGKIYYDPNNGFVGFNDTSPDYVYDFYTPDNAGEILHIEGGVGTQAYFGARNSSGLNYAAGADQNYAFSGTKDTTNDYALITNNLVRANIQGSSGNVIFTQSITVANDVITRYLGTQEFRATASNIFVRSAMTFAGTNLYGMAKLAVGTENPGSEAFTVLGGSSYFDRDVTITGNLFVNGNTTTFTSNNITLKDSMIYLADENPADTVDIGFVASFNNVIRYQHTGFVRDATDGVWKLFANVVPEPTTTIDFTNATYSNLQVGNLTLSGITPSTSTTTGALVVTGGVGIGGNLYVAGNIRITEPAQSTSTTTGALVVTGGVGIGSNLYVARNTRITDASLATSTTTGALVVTGGVGIGGNLFVGGNIQDSKGDVRASPINSQPGSYTAVATDAGKTITESLLGAAITFNANVFAAGDMVSVINTSAGNITLVQGTSVTIRLAGTATTGNRTVASNGLATLICSVGGATPTFYCSGAGLT
jgi:hypothetical protein